MVSFIHPHEYLFDDEEKWTRLEGTLNSGRLNSEESLEDARESCRQLALTNEFAICGHENRISFVVGSGHRISVEKIPESSISASVVRAAQDLIDEFIQENNWFSRQQEIQRRKDRDGEVFIRYFVDHEGKTSIRFIEPEDIFTPDEFRFSPELSAGNFRSSENGFGNQGGRSINFGIETHPDDSETVLGYWVKGKFLPASWIQHRKANVDAGVSRGIPVFYPVRKNLRRAEKLLRNMSVVAEIQSAIAIIRKHSAGSRLGIENFAAASADSRISFGNSSKSLFTRSYSPGTILDTSAGVEYQFPVAAVDASRYILVLQAELRAIASRLVMPEFMLTSDASNANYSSTMIAEGPSVRMFERLQREMITEDLRLMKRVLLHAVQAQKLPPEAIAELRIQITPPILTVRDRLKEVQADQILVELGAITVDELRDRFSTVQKIS
ncbi:MAG: phage portal protein [Planctomycetaceae bacterium]|nr:phage portal protein [Planctomycetaceae bacterium]MBQ2821603.1 phage portal protein [Thermoguttaceae bacterium]